MHLSNLFIENFRLFGSRTNSAHLDLELQPGLNVLAGENDSGKSAIIDAIRIVLQTSSFDFYRLTEDDFHLGIVTSPLHETVSASTSAQSNEIKSARAIDFTIRCTFSGLGNQELSQYLEWLSVDHNKKPVLHITLRARRNTAASGRDRRNSIPYTVHSGVGGDGPKIEGDIREFLRATYLKPLRDAEAELSAGRNSRLSQILESHPSFSSQDNSDFDPTGEASQVPLTLIGIFRQAEHRIANNTLIHETKDTLNSQYLNELSLGDENLSARIGVSRETELRQILEKFELWLEPPFQLGTHRTRRGLGYNNILFMATELLLLGNSSSGSNPMLLIEEPEAHLHPQMQMRLMDFLENKSQHSLSPSNAKAQDSISVSTETIARASDQPQDPSSSEPSQETTQILLTTHSPNLASKAQLSCMTLICQGRAYSLASGQTRLSESDYKFLERFLDVTKSNLFFAKGVLMVEGDAENILIPTLATLLGRPFSKFGVSIVNVGHTGFFRFGRILQSNVQGKVIPIKVACLADRDVVADSAENYVTQKKDDDGNPIPTFESQFENEDIEKKVSSKKQHDGGNVRTFVSPKWTLEHDLAFCGLAAEVYAAVKAAKLEESRDKNTGSIATDSDLRSKYIKAKEEIANWRKDGQGNEEIAARIYEDLYRKRASKATTAQMLAQILIAEPMPSKELQIILPEYILEAIEYLTGPGLTPAKDAQSTEN
jgi:putative ATP-dependent endonuclease of the OLD family